MAQPLVEGPLAGSLSFCGLPTYMQNGHKYGRLRNFPGRSVARAFVLFVKDATDRKQSESSEHMSLKNSAERVGEESGQHKNLPFAPLFGFHIKPADDSCNFSSF